MLCSRWPRCSSGARLLWIRDRARRRPPHVPDERRACRIPAFRFETAESLDRIGTSAAGRVLRFTRVVAVRRPDALFFEVAGSGDTALDVSAYYDGRTVSLSDKTRGVWAQTTAPGTLDEMLDDVARRYALPVPIADVVYSAP